MHREEYLGSEHLLYGEIGLAKAVARFPATVDVDAELGQTYEFVVAGEQIKQFDTNTGMRLRTPS